MINLCQPRQPGDILRLHGPIGDIEPDTYVLLSLGDTCCLAFLGRTRQGNGELQAALWMYLWPICRGS